MAKEKLVKEDIGLIEDMMDFLEDAIALESHLEKTFEGTQNKKYSDLLNEARKIRTKYLSILNKVKEGENWCSGKHALGCSRRLRECGVRFASTEQLKEAKECFKDAWEFEKIFMKLNDLGEGEIKSSA